MLERRDHAGSVTFVNGEETSPDAPSISVRDRGLTLADGLFETLRVHSGHAFQHDAHLARMRRGLAALSIPLPPDLERQLAEALRAYGDRHGSARLTVTRGPGPGGLSVHGDARPTVIVTVGPMPAFPAATYEQGLSAFVPAGRRNPRAVTAGLKTLSYTDAVVALLEAVQKGYDEALFLDTDDHLSEASASNLFVWTGSALVTPPVSCGALPGITRESVLRLARDAGMAAVERTCTLEDLASAEEAFLTSSLRGLAPLVRVDNRAVGGGRPGPLTRRLAAMHEALVEQECR
jgi:branched-chain amino acid aminotransferase